MATILTTSIPDAIDYILGVIRGLAFATANPPLAIIYDGLPDQPDNPPDNFVSIGGAVENMVDGRDSWQSLGGAPLVPTHDEDYRISAYVSCYRGGSGGTVADASDAQKAARDAAFLIFRQIETGLRGDPKLGTVIGTGWQSFADTTRVLQTAYGDAASGMGRACTIEFDIAVYRRKCATWSNLMAVFRNRSDGPRIVGLPPREVEPDATFEVPDEYAEFFERNQELVRVDATAPVVTVPEPAPAE